MSQNKSGLNQMQAFWHDHFAAEDQLNYEAEDKQAEFPPGVVSALRLMREPALPVSIHVLNQFSSGAKQRIYRTLLPPDLLAAFNIDPITWKGADGERHVVLVAPPDKGLVKIVARHATGARDPFAYLELVDTSFNSINVVLLVLSDPEAPRFDTDVSEDGQPTLFGTVHRNLAAEEAAMQAGLAPGQVRQGLRASSSAVRHLEAFLSMLGHGIYYGEPLSYAAAILFEHRGFSYVTGRRIMETIDREFRPGGRLYQALDGSTPFRQPEQWRTIRGRAWAIHDGILKTIGLNWDGIRMSKRLGRHARVDTFPDAKY
ncbi:MAG TPA: hypothetical protein VE553_07195 [Candidatus Binatia bacterium]|jgi:hypothetical protein|nr:hypothetical protein [Candidatus Binatia bacterium]